MITIGYADEKPEPPPRKELDEIRFFQFWDKTGHV
jgi:nitroreductase